MKRQCDICGGRPPRCCNTAYETWAKTRGVQYTYQGEGVRCRHGRAWPTIWGGVCGLMWCPDCGARREIVCANGTSFSPKGPWIYPRGSEDVLRQMERARVKP